MPQKAVILFNLGGPDSVKTVRPFLFNLFNDKYIIGAPSIIRFMIAWLISTRRSKKMESVYQELGDGSPLIPNTQAQADALQQKLGEDYKVLINMRYWHPMADEVTKQVKKLNPEEIILLPLYPQFSTTTTLSSYDEWQKFARKNDIDNIKTKLLCCYPYEENFVEAVADLLQEKLDLAMQENETKPKIFFSAHGLPQKIVDGREDPYPEQIKMSAEAVVNKLSKRHEKYQNLDWIITYQSRVGPVEWIKPYTDKEIEKAGKEKKPLILLPIAFVSEHIETLEEMDMEFKEIAEESGVPNFYRVPTVSVKDAFIEGLKNLVKKTEASNRTVLSLDEKCICGSSKSCPNRKSHRD